MQFIITVLFFKTFAIQMCVQKSCQGAIENFSGLLHFRPIHHSMTDQRTWLHCVTLMNPVAYTL